MEIGKLKAQRELNCAISKLQGCVGYQYYSIYDSKDFKVLEDTILKAFEDDFIGNVRNSCIKVLYNEISKRPEKEFEDVYNKFETLFINYIKEYILFSEYNSLIKEVFIIENNYIMIEIAEILED